MNNYGNKPNLQRKWPVWRWMIFGLNILALTISAILSWHYMQGSSFAGCGDGSPCEQVINSHWSTLAGILPVSGLAFGVYLSLLIAGFFIGPDTEFTMRRLAWSIMLILAGSIAGSALWFIILQKWMIKEFCPYCMTAHVTGLLLTALLIWKAVNESRIFINDKQEKDHTMVRNSSQTIPGQPNHPSRVVGLTLTGFALACMLAAIQAFSTPSQIYSEGESQESPTTLDYHNIPMVGSPEAPYIINVLFDYQCSHCQKIHFMLNEVIRHYDGKLAFALNPVPLSSKCNPYVQGNADTFNNSCDLTRIGLAVWIADRESFPAFENWMFSYESGDRWLPRSIETARSKAIELVGQEKFDNALSDKWIDEYMQTSVQIFGQTIQGNRGGIPKMIFGSNWVIPQPNSPDDLISILQESLAVPLP